MTKKHLTKAHDTLLAICFPDADHTPCKTARAHLAHRLLGPPVSLPQEEEEEDNVASTFLLHRLQHTIGLDPAQLEALLTWLGEVPCWRRESAEALCQTLVSRLRRVHRDRRRCRLRRERRRHRRTSLSESGSEGERQYKQLLRTLHAAEHVHATAGALCAVLRQQSRQVQEARAARLHPRYHPWPPWDDDDESGEPAAKRARRTPSPLRAAPRRRYGVAALLQREEPAALPIPPWVGEKDFFDLV